MRAKIQKINGVYPVTLDKAVYITGTNKTLEQELKALKRRSTVYNIDLSKKTRNQTMRDFLQSEIDNAYTEKFTKVVFPKNEILEVIDEYNGDDGNAPKNYKPTMIKLHSNTKYDLNGSTIKIKPNNYIGYVLFDFRLNNNITLYNGIIEGDKDNHTYKDTSTNEWGYGALFAGSKFCYIKNVEIKNMTGDGSYLGGILSFYSPSIPQTDMEIGKLDDSGAPVADENSYRLNKLLDLNTLLDENDKTKGLSLKNKLFLYPGNEHGYGPLNQFKRKHVVVCFYNESERFISLEKTYLVKPINIPEGAKYVRYYFPNNDMSNMNDQSMMIRIGESSEQCFLDECHIHDCRRQGISISNSINSGVRNSIIERIKGAAPQSCVDIEDGGHATEHIVIENNTFRDSIYGVVNYDGNNHIISNNYFDNCNQSLSINACGGLRIIDNTVHRGKVSFNTSTDFGAYSPRIAIIDGNNFYNCKQLYFIGNIIATNTTARCIEDFRIEKGAIFKDSLVVEERVNNFRFQFKDSKIDNVIFESKDNITFEIRLENCNMDNCNTGLSTIQCLGETTIKNCKLYSYSLPIVKEIGSEFNILFEDCIMERNNGVYRITSELSNKVKLTFRRCKIKQTEKYVYGFINFYENMSIIIDNCNIIYYGDYFIYTGDINYNGKLTIKDSEITALNQGRLYTKPNSNLKAILSDSKFTKITEPDIANNNIIDEDNIWEV